jgi:hypothetical protein
MSIFELYLAGAAAFFGPGLLPLVLPFIVLLQYLGEDQLRPWAISATGLAAGFAAGLGLLNSQGTALAAGWGWITLAAGLVVAASGAAIVRGWRPPAALAAPLLGFCLAFGAPPLRGPVLDAIPAEATADLSFYAAGVFVSFVTLTLACGGLLRKIPPVARGAVLMAAGALIATGAYAGIGFTLAEWLPPLARLG